MTRPAVVLVVEDHPLIRLNSVDELETAGFEVLEAGNADEAISLLKARADVQLVFTDVEMPGTMDGVKLSHFIRDGCRSQRPARRSAVLLKALSHH